MSSDEIPDWLRAALDEVVGVVATLAGVDEVVYAASGAFVPDLGQAEPPEVTVRMDLLQTTVAGQVVVPLRHVETPRAREPFDLFAASR